jgi:hypothetical protein
MSKNPRYFFERESPVFRKMFADSALSGNHRIGASDNEPLVLNEVRTDDFSRFLWVFYNPCVYFISTLSPLPRVSYLMDRSYPTQHILNLRRHLRGLGRHSRPRALLAVCRGQISGRSGAREADHPLDFQDRHLPQVRGRSRAAPPLLHGSRL